MGKKRGRKASRAAPGPPVPSEPYTIVGIGASAGGLEALELFLRHMPTGSGLALVVVQHMDPTAKGMLVEILQRASPMPVVEISDGVRLVADHVYVIPPNADLSLMHGVLHLLDPDAPRGMRLPIDFFFRSLAEDLRERGVGVILSGMGSDGAVGLRAIKEHGGAVFVQSPTSAKFDGMPRSAVESGLCDVIAPVEDLPAKIVAYLKQLPSPRVAPVDDGHTLEKVFVLLRARTGHDFSQYKRSTVRRRVERRMVLHQLGQLTDYVRFLRGNPQELDLLFSEMLIGVTSFFRDPGAWEQVRTEVMPMLFAQHPEGGQLRAWVAGCSTGEEAYSLAMVFREAQNAMTPPRNISLQIFATDLDRRAVDRARVGLYPAGIAAEVSAERLSRFFVEEERGFRVKQEIRDLVVFAPQNVFMDPPFLRLDLLSCRNLLIYLEPELQQKVLRLFHYSLNAGGFLLLGSAETVGPTTTIFALQPGAARLFRRLELPHSARELGLPSVVRRTPGPSVQLEAGDRESDASPVVPNVQVLAERVLVQRYGPAAVLATALGDIVYINGKTGNYLEPAMGKANWNLFVMAREGLSGPLLAAFRQALALGELVTLRDLQVGTHGGAVRVNVTLEPLVPPSPLSGMVMVVFVETPPVFVVDPSSARLDRSEAPSLVDHVRALDELSTLRAELQVKAQEMEASRAEARAASEELMSTNEELQSTNEELTASKEEMQSMNEELHTVNYELRAKLDELSRTSSDMKNLLNATDIATLFLDADMRVRHFTPQTSQVIKLIPGDVGRPISDLSRELNYPDLVPDAQAVLATLLFRERTVSATNERWYTVRIMPYAAHDNRIDGVVVTFSDVSVAKRLEAELRATEAELRKVIATRDGAGAPT